MKEYYSISDQFIFKAKQIKLNSNIKSPGKNLMLISELINVQTEINISLKGKNGKDHNCSAIDQNGAVGSNGSNGGNLSLHFKQYQGFTLNVDLTGGDGGKGQNCQISQNKISEYVKFMQKDFQKSDQNKYFLTNRQDYGFSEKQGLQAFTHVLKSLGTFNGQVLQTYSTKSLRAWKKYYQLMPGAGGNPGKSGFLHIQQNGVQCKKEKIQNFCTFTINQALSVIGSKSVYNCKRNIQDPKKGQDGKIILDNYQGKYIKQMVFCALRKEGKKVNQQTVKDAINKQILLGTATIGGQLIASQIAQQAAFTASRMAFKTAMKQGAKVVVKQAGKQAVEIAGTKAALHIAQTAGQQAIKQVTFQTAQTVGTAGLFGAGLSLGIGLAVQGVLSPISAALSNSWKQPIKKLQNKTQMQVPFLNNQMKPAELAIKLSKQNINLVLKRFKV